MMPKLSPLIIENANFIRRLQNSKRSNRAVETLISSANEVELLCLVEICLNLLKGRIPHNLLKKYWQRLLCQADLLRRVSRARSARKARQMLLPRTNQQGKGLPAVAGILASILAPMLIDALHK